MRHRSRLRGGLQLPYAISDGSIECARGCGYIHSQAVRQLDDSAVLKFELSGERVDPDFVHSRLLLSVLSRRCQVREKEKGDAARDHFGSRFIAIGQYYNRQLVIDISQ